MTVASTIITSALDKQAKQSLIFYRNSERVLPQLSENLKTWYVNRNEANSNREELKHLEKSLDLLYFALFLRTSSELNVSAELNTYWKTEPVITCPPSYPVGGATEH